MDSETRPRRQVKGNDGTGSTVAPCVREPSESDEAAAPIRRSRPSEGHVIAAGPGTSHPRSSGSAAIISAMAASFDPPFDPPFDPSVTPELLAFIGERGH